MDIVSHHWADYLLDIHKGVLSGILDLRISLSSKNLDAVEFFFVFN